MAALTRDSELSGRYRLTSRIATGGMGEVWRAEDTLLHRQVAVKVLKHELTCDPKFLERFRAEARNTAALSHPGIAAVHDYGEVYDGEERTAYLVMELVPGEPLSTVLVREVRLPVPRVLDIVGQAAAALDAAHRTGMVHRDVKPGNILVGPDGTVKITDFGIARVADMVPLTQAGMVVGTAQYFAPEQAEGKATSPASDVYSLGVVAYECLAGRLPFVADSSVAVAVMQIRDAAPPLPDDIPPPVRALIARAMAKDARTRFLTGGEFAAAVRAVREGRPVEGPPQVGAPPVPPPHGVPVHAPHAIPPPGPAPAPAPVAASGSAQVPPLGHPQGTTPGMPPPPLPAPSAPPQVPAHSRTAPGIPRPPLPPPAQPGPPPVSGAVPVPGPGPGPGGSGRIPAGYGPGRRRRRAATLWVTLLVALAAAVLVVVVVLAHRGHAGTGRVGDNAPAGGGPGRVGRGGEAPAPAVVHIAVGDYQGRPSRQVVENLTRLGLHPTVQYRPEPGVAPGTVISVQPAGNVPVGSRIVVVVAGPVPGHHHPNEKDDH